MTLAPLHYGNWGHLPIVLVKKKGAAQGGLVSNGLEVTPHLCFTIHPYPKVFLCRFDLIRPSSTIMSGPPPYSGLQR